MSEPQTLLDALLAAQVEFPEIPKDRENTYFKSRYSTLDAIFTATRPVLNKHRILIDHYTQKIEGRWHMVARLTFVPTKEERTNAYPLAENFDDMSPQAKGSEITYGRRYSFAPMIGITSDEDDDGNAATAAAPKKGATQQRKPESKPAPKPTEKAPPKKSMAQHFKDCPTPNDLGALLTKWMKERPVGDDPKKWDSVYKAALKEANERTSSTEWQDPGTLPEVLENLKQQIDTAAQGALAFK